MKKVLLVIILLTAGCVSCSAPGAISPTLRASSLASSPIIQIESPTASVFPSIASIAASPSNTTQPQVTKTLDSSVEGLLALIAASDSQTDIAWVRENYPFPNVVQDYGSHEMINAKYIKPKMKKLLAYVRPADASHIDLDDVKWVKANNDAGYEIINSSEDYKRFALANDAMIFVNFDGADVVYSIPVDSLANQISYKGNNLFTVYFEGSTVKLMIEHYQP
jgi:hypothetical protein